MFPRTPDRLPGLDEGPVSISFGSLSSGDTLASGRDGGVFVIVAMEQA